MFSRLVNDLMQDPLLYTGFDSCPDRILFDCGYMFGLSLRDVQRISSVFVSHTHFDHFMGFDHLLRLSIEMDKTVELYGPPGFIGQVAGKLSGYSWNLCSDLALDFLVIEIDPPFVRRALMRASEAYSVREMGGDDFSFEIKRGDGYAVSVAVMDHIIPSLAFSIREDDLLKVNTGALSSLGLRPGPWVGVLKRDLESGTVTGDMVLPSGESVPRASVAGDLFFLRHGKKTSYIVDTVYSERTLESACRLADGSDELYCECSFLSEDADKAAATHHLTAMQAGMIAREAGVKRLFPVHLSKRYNGRIRDLLRECSSIFPDVCIPSK